jgi:hypothetical protein
MNSIWGGSKIKFNTSRVGSGKNVLMQTKNIYIYRVSGILLQLRTYLQVHCIQEPKTNKDNIQLIRTSQKGVCCT